MRCPSPPPITVFGATGVVGQRVCRELTRMGARVSVVGRHAQALAEVARTTPVAAVQLADAGDPAALVRAFAGARVVINAAGPLGDTAAHVLTGALAAGAHYVDVGGEQTVLHAIYESYESAARHAGLIAVPGAGVDGAIGDLAAAWACGHLISASDPGGPVRDEPAPRLADDHPLDDVTVTYVFDELALSAGSQRALFGAIGSRPLVWRRDRWETGRAGAKHEIDAGSALGGSRVAQAHGGGEVITIPRHIATRQVSSFVSTTRHPGAASALRLVSHALRLVPARARELVVAYAAPEIDYRRTQLAVIAEVRRGDNAARITVRGHDLYRATAVVAAWSACRLAERGAGPVGMRAPAELFRAEPALREIASAADLTIEPGF